MKKYFRSPNRMHNIQYLYKYMSLGTAKVVLANRTLRWSSPVNFNDPFDVTQELRVNFDAHDLQRALARRMATLVECKDPIQIDNPQIRTVLQFISAAPKELRERIAADIRKGVETAATPGQASAFKNLQELWRSMVPKFRVLCLSERNDVTSMWQHYAASYQGVVLELEANDKLDSPLLVARPVTYQDAPPAIANVDEWVSCMIGESESSYEDLFSELQYVKTTDWQYEREWRIVSMARPGESGLYADYPFHPRVLAGVYLGSSCSQSDVEDIKGLLDHGLEHVRIWKAVKDHVSGKFVFDEVIK